MKFVWMGAEAPNDVDLLYGVGVRDFGISLSSFKRRVKKPGESLERYADDTRLYLYDTEAWSTEATSDVLLESAEKYEKFVSRYYSQFYSFQEFSSPALGKEFLLDRREEFYDDDTLGDGFWVTWFPTHGYDHLKYLGEAYTDVAIPRTALTPQTVSVIRSLASEYQTRFHCLGLSLDESAPHHLFTSTFMSTWSSAIRHQDLYVPQNDHWIKRVPKEDTATQIKRHGDFVESLGCDPQLLIDGNNSEREIYLVRLFRWVEDHSALLPLLSENSASAVFPILRGNAPQVSDSDGQDYLKNDIENQPYLLPQNEGVPLYGNVLPTMEIEGKSSVLIDDDGKMMIADVPVVRRSTAIVRSCDSCALSSVCPAFQPSNPCKFKMPVQIRTKDQMAALTEAILETQASRIFFATFAEEVTGFHDPTVGKEMDRFAKLASMFSKLGESKETMRLEASRTTSGGVLSQIFGKKV